MRRAWLCMGVLYLFACNQSDDAEFSASVIAEGTAIKLSPQTGGLVLDIRFEEGSSVQPGDTLAIIDTEKMGYQLEQLSANLDELSAQREIAETNLQKARDENAYAQTRLTRAEELFQKNAATEQMRDDVKINATRAAAAVRAARQTLASLDTRQAALQAQRKLLQKQISDGTLISPIGGTVSVKYYHTGETVPVMAPLLEVIDLTEMWAKIYLTETMLPKIKIGQQAKIAIDGTRETLSGRVAWVSPKAEFTPKNILTEETRTGLVFAVKIDIDNPDGLLKHGMPIAVSLPFSQN